MRSLHLTDGDVDDYVAMVRERRTHRDLERQLAALQQEVRELAITTRAQFNALNETLPQLLEVVVSETATNINTSLDALETRLTAAIAAESEEDRQAASTIADKQAQLDEANAEITRLRAELEAGTVSPEEAAAIGERIGRMSAMVEQLAGSTPAGDGGSSPTE